MSDNIGYIQIGTSYDTSKFACDSIRYWWNTYGKGRYPLANSILFLCNGGWQQWYTLLHLQAGSTSPSQ
ncbi:hypothetical protein IFO70_38125 [Phormidium tenue FACHB-886]|nr:hypothetical protein [Phormidium tenue FACHB-886]